jgi:hypothetical protein
MLDQLLLHDGKADHVSMVGLIHADNNQTLPKHRLWGSVPVQNDE